MKQLKNFLIKREQSQACLSFAKREKSRLLAKTLLTLVALLAVTTGAWATDDTYTVKFEANGKSKTIENVTLEKTWACNYASENGELDQIIKELYELESGCSNTNPNTSVTGGNGKVTVVSSNNQSITITEPFEGTATVTGGYINQDWSDFTYSLTISIPGYTASSATPVDIDWNATTKTASIASMPAGNVTVTAEYFPQATAAEGALTAATGVAATTSEPLVTLDASKLTGATKLMYFVNKSTDPAPGYDAQGWSDKVPTADSFTESGGYNVYYYPLGTDDADPAKTYRDGDICAAPILVSLAAAPTYDVSFRAANANTIESGKATVTVGGAAATLTEGKVTGVKMGQQVKMTAAQGYKFRKVEVEKTTDFTDCVSTTAWTGMDAMSPAFSTPEVTTSDGRKTRFAEVYRTDVSATGVIMQQTVNVANGTYIVELYANSCAAQDVTTDMADGATDVAYVFANDVKKFITSKIASAFSESGVYTLEVTVTDGQLTLGIGKEKAGTNWHTIQIKSLNQKASSGNE